MKEFISKHHKLLIILLAILVVILVIAILLFNSEESSNVIPRNPYELSLVNIDDLEYDFIDTYYSEFTLENGGYEYQVEANLFIEEDGICQYSSEWDSDIGYYIFETTGCNYSVGKNKNIQITMNGTLKLYNNSLGAYQTEQISDYTLNGIFKYENKSHLLLNGITFENIHYYIYSQYGANEMLVDANNNTYRTDGTLPWGEESKQLDLSLYTIVDRRNTDNNTSDYDNYYDITDIASGDLINVQRYYYFVDYIDADEFRRLYNDDEKNIIALGANGCTYCTDLIEDLQSFQTAYFFHAKYLVVSTLNSEDYHYIEDFIINELGIDMGYPITIIVQNGKIIDYIRGYNKYSTEEFLRKNEIIK